MTTFACETDTRVIPEIGEDLGQEAILANAPTFADGQTATAGKTQIATL
jgi:hypothetical protein